MIAITNAARTAILKTSANEGRSIDSSYLRVDVQA